MSPKLFRQPRQVWLMTTTIALAIVAGSFLGWLNLLEWAVRDQFFRMRPAEAKDDRIVIVTIDEADIQSVKNWPIPDETLAAMLLKIRAQQPRAIGLDLYRDLPEEPGHQQLLEVFRSTPNLFGVEKMTGDRVAPPPLLDSLNRVGLADLVLDGDRKIRRALLSATDQQDGNQIKSSLSAQVALHYLKAEQIQLEPIDPDHQVFRLGKATFAPLQPHEAGYRKTDLGGFQILLNWRGDQSLFPMVSMRDLLAGNVAPDLMRDRIVLIGSIAPSTNDFFETPFSSNGIGTARPTPGVVIHANIASQIIQSAKFGRSGMQGFSGWQQTLWIVTWAAIGTLGSWSLANRFNVRSRWGGRVLWATLASSGGLMILAHTAFRLGYITPVISPLLALVSTVVSTTQIHKHHKLQEMNLQLEQMNAKLESANQQLTEYSKTLEQRVEQRTEALQKLTQELEQRVDDRTAALAQSLKQLQQAQVQLVQSEKMSTLGQLVAGVAHEINNPLGFIAGNLQPAANYIDDLLYLIDRYQAQFPEPGPEINRAIKKIDLDYLRDDLPKLIGSMQEGTDRIRHISVSLRTFSRADTDQKTAFDLHEGLDSTLMILKHRLKATDQRPAIEIVKQYGSLPLVQCFAGQLNQVFMNILANAIDAIDELSQEKTYESMEQKPPQIMITTELVPAESAVTIRIRDTALGIPDDIKARIFEHLFTTKPVGQGTGLGLSIAQRIVQEVHGGRLMLNSQRGEGTEFIIQIPQ